jgi:Tfp pilus assembly protein PilF
MGKGSKEKKRDSSKRKCKDDSREAELLTEGSRHRFNTLLIHSLLIIALGILVYSNSLNSPFQWDEKDFIVQNPIVKNLGYFLEPSKAKGVDPDFYIFLKTRYIGYLTFALNYKIHGFNVLGYHIFNLAIHLLNALWVYLFILLTFKTPFLRQSFLKKNSSLIALFSALLFVSHPLQTEAVTYIFQRHASFVTFFYLSSFVLYIQGRLCMDDQKTSHFKSTLFFILSFIATVFAMKTKENAFTLPIVLMIYEIFFFTGMMKRRIFRLIPWLLSMVIIPYTLIGTHRPIGEVINQILDPSLLVQQEVSREVYLFTQFRVILTYIRLLFLPVHQNLDYDYPVYHSFFTPQAFLPFLFHLAVLGLAVYLFYQSRLTIPDWRLSSFGIFWFFITLSVESSIISLPMIICEYRVYLPSIGWLMAITTSVWIVWKKLEVRVPWLKKEIILFFVSVLIIFSSLTYARNIVWRDEVRMWKDVTHKSPNKARGHYNLGLTLGKQGWFEEAIREFQMTLRLNPNHAKAHNNLGVIYNYQGQLDDAIREYQSALTINPKDANVYYNLGIVLARKHRLEDAVREFQAALKLDPNNANAHNNLGAIFAQQDRLDEAIKEFKAALEINPDHVSAQNNLRQVYHKKDK